MTKEQALEILKENVKNENLRKHGIAVGLAMRALAEFLNEKLCHSELGSESLSFKDRSQSLALGNSPAEERPDPSPWEITGLLHDADYETTKDTPEQHTLVISNQLKNLENSEPSRLKILEDIIQAIKAHNYEYTGVEPQSLMDSGNRLNSPGMFLM